MRLTSAGVAGAALLLALALLAPALVGERTVAGYDVGLFTLPALQLVPEGDANGRVSTAIQCAVRAADSRDLDGPRALPLAVLDETYVRGLIAAHATDALRWMRSAHGDRLPPSIREEIDSYLRNADLATSDQAARTLAPRMSTRS